MVDLGADDLLNDSWSDPARGDGLPSMPAQLPNAGTLQPAQLPSQRKSSGTKFPVYLVCGIGGGLVAVLLLGIMAYSLFFGNGDNGATGTSGTVGPFPDATVGEVAVKAPPFDVDAFLELPSDDRNAAPPYLAAMCEFDDDVEPPPGDSGPMRGGLAVSQRKRQINELYRRWRANRNAVTDGQIAPLLSSLLGGYKKLTIAQQRQDCVFPLCLSFASLVPQAGAAKTIHRATVLKTLHELNRDDLDAAIGNVEMMLRLSRDLRRRAPLVSQIVASVVEGEFLREITGPILNHPKVTVAQCERLLEIIRAHEANAIDCHAEGLRSEYLLCQMMLHDVEHGTGAFSPEGLRKAFEHLPHPPQTVAEGIVQYMAEAVGPGKVDRDRSLRAAERALSHMASSGAYDVQRTFLNDAFSRMLAAADASIVERKAAARAVREELFENPQDLYLLTVMLAGLEVPISAFARNDIALQATECQVAARRWQLEHNGELSDLASMVEAAGMDSVPTDPYSGDPLKMIGTGDDFTIYSVGDDGKDDKARIDSQGLADKKGDVVFRMGKWK